MKSKYYGVIFDLDGTLVDTLGDIAGSMNHALNQKGFPQLPTEDFRDKVGWGIRRLAFLSLPEDARDEETVASVASCAASFYSENAVVLSRPYPGVTDLLGILKTKKVKTVVLTNKPDSVAGKIISGLFPPGTFDRVQGEVSGKPRKPDPSCAWEILADLDLIPSDAVFVGDSEVDMETAVSAGCYALGVSWGYRSRQVIEKAGAKRIIDEPSGLLDFFP